MHAFLSELPGGSGAGAYISGALGLWVFSAAVCAMSVPDAKSSKAYEWLYRFSHVLAANLDRVGLNGSTEESASEAQPN